jgi:hypothetical protein
MNQRSQIEKGDDCIEMSYNLSKIDESGEFDKEQVK